jgi:hypothetical protein
MNYATPAALRAALDARLANQSRESGIDLNRLRRRVVFERLLARLSRAQHGTWVLKGGMALEIRWANRARATRDLDLAAAVEPSTAEALELCLHGALAADSDGDWFRFAYDALRPLTADEAGRPGWRIPIEATLAGRLFARVHMDVVLRMEEISGTEFLPLANVLSFAGIPSTEVEVIDRRQHFAEKLHALTRVYPDRPNSRVRDLPDLLMLIDDGLVPDRNLHEVAERLFATRATHGMPTSIPDPPAEWEARYRELATDLEVGAKDLGAAMQQLRSFWSSVTSTKDP